MEYDIEKIPDVKIRRFFGAYHVPALVDGITEYIEFYNEERPHQALDYLTPLAVYKKADKGVNGALALS